MRTHIISDVFPPEPVTSAGTAREIAEELTRRGHEVTVFAPFPNRPTGHLMDGYQRRWRQVEQRDGYRIVYSWHTLSKSSTLISRTAENISFGLTSTLQLLREPAPDVTYMNTWPIFAQWLNSAAMFARASKLICVVHDLYPETFAETRMSSALKAFIRPVRAIDASVYRMSTMVTALNSTQAEYLSASRGLSSEKIRVWNDWVDASGFPTGQPKDGDFRKRHGIPEDKFLAMYVGSLTRMAGLELYVQAAEKLRHRSDIEILLVGDGAMRDEVETEIRTKKLENIRVIHPLEPKDVPAVQAAADVLVLSLLPGAAEHTTPSKMIFYMFSQRPVIGSVKEDGPPARIIKDASCGNVIRQGDPQDLATKLEAAADDRESLLQMGDNARRYAEAHFLKENVLPLVCDMIEDVGQNNSHPRRSNGNGKH